MIEMLYPLKKARLVLAALSLRGWPHSAKIITYPKRTKKPMVVRIRIYAGADGVRY